MIEFHFEKLRLDGDIPSSDIEVILRVVADFSILVSGASIPLYREEEFCVVEFALQITQWINKRHGQSIDFSYDSMSSDESGLISIRKQEHGWSLTALHQDFMIDRVFSIKEIDHAVMVFVGQLRTEVWRLLKYDVTHLVSGRPITL